MSSRRYVLKDDPYSSHAVILSRLGPGHGGRLLDVGAADGFLAAELSRLGWRVTAIERDPASAALARPHCQAAVVADLERDVPALEDTFDAIVCGDVLEHLSNPRGTLTRLLEHLAPGGVVVVSVPNVAHLWVRLSLLVGRFEYAERGILDRTHLRFFTRRTFLELLRGAGLHAIEIVPTPAPLPLVVPRRFHGRWLRGIHAANAAAARWWQGGLAYQFVALCRASGSPACVAEGACPASAASGT